MRNYQRHLRFSQNEKQDKASRLRIEEYLLKLAENPFNKTELDIVPITGKKDMFRLKFGKIRIIYMLNKGKLIILTIERSGNKITNRNCNPF